MSVTANRLTDKGVLEPGRPRTRLMSVAATKSTGRESGQDKINACCREDDERYNADRPTTTRARERQAVAGKH